MSDRRDRLIGQMRIALGNLLEIVRDEVRDGRLKYSPNSPYDKSVKSAQKLFIQTQPHNMSPQETADEMMKIGG